MIGVYIDRNFRLLLAAFPLLFPLYLLRFSVTVAGFEVPFTVPEAATYLFFLLFLAKEIIELRREENPAGVVCGLFSYLLKVRGKNHWNAIAVPVLLLVIAATIGIFMANNLSSALGIYKGWVIAPILYFVMWSASMNDQKSARLSLHFYLLSASILAFWALWQVYSGIYLTIDMRASGPFESANYLAMYLGPAVAVLLVLLYKKFEQYRLMAGEEMWVLLIELLVCVPALYFSYSYAALLAVFFAFFLYFLFRYGFEIFCYWRKMLLILIATLGLLAGVIFFAQSDTHKLKNFLVFDRSTSSSVRVELWTVAMKFALDNPILGIGLGQFQSLYINNADKILGKKPFDPAVLHPHSLYLTFWLYTGFLGLFSFFWIVMSCLVRLKYCLPYLRPYMRLGLVMLTVILLHGFFDTTFWKNDLAYLFWFAVVLTRI